MALSACQNTETQTPTPSEEKFDSTYRPILTPQQAISALKKTIEAYPVVDGINLKDTHIPEDLPHDLVGRYLSPIQVGQWKFYPYRIDEKKVTFSLFYDFASKQIEGNEIPGVINIEFNLVDLEGLTILEFSAISHGAILQQF